VRACSNCHRLLLLPHPLLIYLNTIRIHSCACSKTAFESLLVLLVYLLFSLISTRRDRLCGGRPPAAAAAAAAASALPLPLTFHLPLQPRAPIDIDPSITHRSSSRSPSDDHHGQPRQHHHADPVSERTSAQTETKRQRGCTAATDDHEERRSESGHHQSGGCRSIAIIISSSFTRLSPLPAVHAPAVSLDFEPQLGLSPE